MSDSRQGGTVNPLVRADMVYYEAPGGGAVFATGAISWCGSLSHNGYDNNVSRMTEKRAGALPRPATTGRRGHDVGECRQAAAWIPGEDLTEAEHLFDIQRAKVRTVALRKRVPDEVLALELDDGFPHRTTLTPKPSARRRPSRSPELRGVSDGT